MDGRSLLFLIGPPETALTRDPLGRRAAVATSPAPRDVEDQKRMSFWEHLEELRNRLKVVVAVVVVLFALFLVTAVGSVTIGTTQVPMLLPALGPGQQNIASQFFFAVKGFLVPDTVGGYVVNFTFKSPWDGYIVLFECALFLAAIIGSPVIVYELGQFIGPALKPSEKRLIRRVTTPVLFLFLAGVGLCFVVVLPFTIVLMYQVQIALGATSLFLFADDFIGFVLLFSLAFGLAFQLPVLMYGLSWLGIATSDFWKRYWRIAAVGIFVFGAIITPDGSGVTMMLVALPMLVPYGAGYLASRRLERRRIRAKSS
jgi:sec-independent protein translocase protein TatC